jgi:hypothetical protein
MRLLNLFKNHIVHCMFRQSLVVSRCYKIIIWRPLSLIFSSSVGWEAPSCIRVFRGAAWLLLPRCVFRPRVSTIFIRELQVRRNYQRHFLIINASHAPLTYPQIFKYLHLYAWMLNWANTHWNACLHLCHTGHDTVSTEADSCSGRKSS